MSLKVHGLYTADVYINRNLCHELCKISWPEQKEGRFSIIQVLAHAPISDMFADASSAPFFKSLSDFAANPKSNLPCSSKGIQGKQPKQRDLHLASGWQKHETHAMHRKLKFTIRVVSLTVQFLLWQSQWVFQPLCKVDHSVHMRIGSETTWRRSLGSLRCIYHFRAYQKQPLGAFEFPDGFRSSDGATRWRCLFIWQGAFDKPNAQNHGRPSMITMDTCQDSKNGHNQHEVRRLSCDIHLHICAVVKRWCVYMCIYIYVVYVIPSSL